MDMVSRILGRLEEFQNQSEKRFDNIEKKVDRLNEFKWRMTGGAVVLGILVSFIIRAVEEVFR